MDDRPWLVVGLGNPGAQYEGNRHNVGQMVLAELADRRSTTFRRHKQHALVAEGRSFGAGPKLVLAKPLSFMNESGGPVSKLLHYYSIEPDHLIVVHDELDIPFGSLKLKQGGGHGGHNGVRDIAKATGTADFFRVRVGVGRPPGRQDAADFVLEDFKKRERVELPSVLVDAADAVLAIATDGLEQAQQRFNSGARA